MSRIYSESHRELQLHFETAALADKAEEIIVHSEIAPDERAFIEERDMFFLATVDQAGRPTCSYKGGDRGFIRVLDNRTLAFPIYDGNGMYLSAGNISATGAVGLLFIDFESPRRLRLQGFASIDMNDPLRQTWIEAQVVVRISVESVFLNCARYVHRYSKVESSKFIPAEGAETPIPDWKRRPDLQESLPARDRERIAHELKEVFDKS